MDANHRLADASSEQIERLIASAEDRGTCYRFLAGLILYDPTPGLVEGLLDGSFAGLVGETLRGAGIEQVVSGLGAMKAFLDAREDLPMAELRTALAVHRTRLFRGIAGGFGPPPPYEALHRAGEGISESELLLRLGRFYLESGAGLPDGYAERPDYLGLELDLMGHLCGEEAAAWSVAGGSGAERARRLQRRFLAEHLLTWAPAYCLSLARDADCGFYEGAARLLEGFLASEAALFDIRRDQSTD